MNNAIDKQMKVTMSRLDEAIIDALQKDVAELINELDDSDLEHIPQILNLLVIGYHTAWDALEALNTSVTEPSVDRAKESESSRERIEDYITKSGYTYTVDDIIDSYQNYYKHGFYVSHTTRDCIENLENEIKTLLDGGNEG